MRKATGKGRVNTYFVVYLWPIIGVRCGQ